MRNKTKIYKASFTTIVTYTEETKNTYNIEEEKLMKLEKQIMRKIIEDKKTAEEQYRKLMDLEIYNILMDSIAQTIKTQKLRWYGHKKNEEKQYCNELLNGDQMKKKQKEI